MALQEREVVDRIRTSLREAIDSSKKLAVISLRGAEYDRLRTHLGLIEGACRQLAVYRDDARWLNFGIAMAVCHQKAGDWLRGWSKNGIIFVWSPGHMNEMFVMLAAQLQVILDHVDKLVVQKTGMMGPILPQPAIPEERRFGRPTFERRNQTRPGAQLIVPPKYRRAG